MNTNGNLRKLMKITQHQWESKKIKKRPTSMCENRWTSTKICEKQWAEHNARHNRKGFGIWENQWTSQSLTKHIKHRVQSTKVYEHQCPSTNIQEHQWTSQSTLEQHIYINIYTYTSLQKYVNDCFMISLWSCKWLFEACLHICNTDLQLYKSTIAQIYNIYSLDLWWGYDFVFYSTLWVIVFIF